MTTPLEQNANLVTTTHAGTIADVGAIVFFLGGGFLEVSGTGEHDPASATLSLWLQDNAQCRSR